MKKKLLFACVAILSLSACSNVETPIDASLTKEIALKPMTNVNSRGIVTGTNFPEGRIIVASASYIDNSGSKATYFKGQKFKKNAANAIWRPYSDNDDDYTQIYWPLNDGVDFLAYSLTDNTLATDPEWDNNVAANAVSFTIADNKADADDILYAAANNQKKIDPTATYEKGVGMVFKHAQANINFTIKSNVAVTINSITFDKMYTGGKLTIDNSKTDLKATWDYTGVTAAKKVMPGINPASINAGADAAPLGTSLLVPQQDAVSFTIDYTMGTIHSTYKVPVNRQVWEMGKKYTYAIEINFKEITIKPSVTNWDDQAGEDVQI